MSMEMTARDLYQTSIDAGADDPLVSVLRNNHRGYVDILRAILGTSALDRRNEQLYEEYVGVVRGDRHRGAGRDRLRLRVDGRRHAHRAAAVAAEHRCGPADRLDPDRRGPPLHRARRRRRARRRSRRPVRERRRAAGGQPVGGRLSDDANLILDRRRFLQTSGLTVALGALVAACGGDSAEEGAPGRVGYAPAATPLPTVETNDVVYLRTATSIEQTLVETYERIVGAGRARRDRHDGARADHRGPPGGRHGDGRADDAGRRRGV